jgi:hypothetical protein
LSALIIKSLFKLILLVLSLILSRNVTANDWLSVIRSTPYHYSKNLHKNLTTIRQWVLLERSFCEQKQRHILFNERGKFLAYINNLENKRLTQEKLNQTREALFKQKKVNQWMAGDDNTIGYPFALNCNQPHTNIQQSINRLLGKLSEDRLWGTWDGISAGKKDSPISLIQLVEQVYRAKADVMVQSLDAIEFRYFLAQIIIESGARKNSRSKAQAIGLLQLKESVLQDCQIPKKFYQHRMAQVDCAVRLFHQNKRILAPAFNLSFSNLPLAKKQTLFAMLLVQSYHTGIGRIIKILNKDEFSQAAKYFSNNHKKHSAKDIASGLIFHNLGRTDLGFASLFYVIDVAIVAQDICQQKEISDRWFCSDKP